jgi:hypothetical protein
MQAFERFETAFPSGTRFIESAIERNAMVVAMERGTRWPSWLESFRQRAPNVVVLVQQPNEALDRFAERIEQRKRSLRTEPFKIMTAVLLASHRVRGSAARNRAKLAAALIGTLDLSIELDAERRFVIGTSEPQSPRAAYALLRLAQRLSALAPSTGVSVSTRLWSDSLKTPGVVSR